MRQIIFEYESRRQLKDEEKHMKMLSYYLYRQDRWNILYSVHIYTYYTVKIKGKKEAFFG